jgi:hypothetical protein
MRLAALCLSLLAGTAGADCPEKMQRDPSFMALAVDDKAPRPSSADDFKFVGDTTTFDELQGKVGPPDAAKGARRYLWCLKTGAIVEVELHSAGEIRAVRVDGKTTYKRK